METTYHHLLKNVRPGTLEHKFISKGGWVARHVSLLHLARTGQVNIYTFLAGRIESGL